MLALLEITFFLLFLAHFLFLVAPGSRIQGRNSKKFIFHYYGNIFKIFDLV